MVFKRFLVYRLVNKALRCEDIDQLYAFRFFIGDLSESLARKQEDIIRLNEETLTVYRGTKLSRDEFEKLKENQGNLISTNGFLSTSRYYEVALAFATKISKRSDVESVIFKIKCDVQKLRNIVIFADIKEQSDFEDELEILFDLGAAFRIESVEHDGQLYHINMSVTPEAQAITHHYTEITRHETEERSVVIMFGRLMCQMGEYEKSQKYFEQLLNDPNGEDPAWIEFNIGRSLHYKGNWEAAEIYYNRAYHRMINTNSLRVEDSAYVLNSIGTVLQAQQEYNKALDFHRQALDIYEKHYSMDHLNVDTVFTVLVAYYIFKENMMRL
ncbi:hypothetical protein I4U23_019981 [Adineta vaga]|nr:hypothetical protein I4U23_019981 [Adineta vaga]